VSERPAPKPGKNKDADDVNDIHRGNIHGLRIIATPLAA
jgi:hypothetical protein